MQYSSVSFFHRDSDPKHAASRLKAHLDRKTVEHEQSWMGLPTAQTLALLTQEWDHCGKEKKKKQQTSKDEL